MPRRIGLYPGGNININSENEGGGGAEIRSWKLIESWLFGILKLTRALPVAGFLSSGYRFLRHIFNPLGISFDLGKNIDC